eukprot:3531705-Amphidinium_carterae.1
MSWLCNTYLCGQDVAISLTWYRKLRQPTPSLGSLHPHHTIPSNEWSDIRLHCLGFGLRVSSDMRTILQTTHSGRNGGTEIGIQSVVGLIDNDCGNKKLIVLVAVP